MDPNRRPRVPQMIWSLRVATCSVWCLKQNMRMDCGRDVKPFFKIMCANWYQVVAQESMHCTVAKRREEKKNEIETTIYLRTGEMIWNVLLRNHWSIGYFHDFFRGHSMNIRKIGNERRSSSTARNGCNFWDFLDPWVEIRRSFAAWPAWQGRGKGKTQCLASFVEYVGHKGRDMYRHIHYLWIIMGEGLTTTVFAGQLSSDDWKGLSGN